jgi:hypothetical protein
MQKFVPRSRVEFFTVSAPDWTHGTLNSCFARFIVFRCIWDCFITAVKLGAKRLNWCIKSKSSCDEVTSQFFATSAPKPAHMTLNSYFGAFHSVWVHLGLFRYDSKLGTKRTELVQLMQKLMPWSHIGIICNKCTRFTALDPKLMFWCVSLCLGAFWIIFLVKETRCKTCGTGTFNAKVHATKLPWNFCNKHTRCTPLDPKLMFCCVS